MIDWKGLFTENEAKLLIEVVNSELIKNDKHNNRGNLKIAVNEVLGSIPVRDSIINKLESLSQQQVNEIINACIGLGREENRSELQSVFNPQQETFQK
jgi:hypothetical protein